MSYLFDPVNDIDRLKTNLQITEPIDSIDEILRYIIYMYDPGSDLRLTHTDFAKRKREAAKLAKLPTTRTSDLTDYSKDILVGANNKVNCLIIEYLKLHNSPYLLQYHAHWNLLSQEILDSENLGERTPQERKIIRENIRELTDSISDAESHLFGGGKDTEALRNALFADMTASRATELRPEKMALALEKKEAVIGKNPFYPGIE